MGWGVADGLGVGRGCFIGAASADWVEAIARATAAAATSKAAPMP